MLSMKGMPISPGYASGIAVIYDYEIQRKFELPHRAITHSEVQSEHKRVDEALDQSSHDLKQAERAALGEGKRGESVALASAHAMMAAEIAALVKKHIGREFVNVEQALDAVVNDFVKRFEQLESPYFRQREQDVRDVGRRMMRNLGGAPPWTDEPLPPGSVIVTRELLPSEIIELAQSGLVAIVSELGGIYSHTAIIARSLGIPAITGIANVTAQILPGMRLLVDGETGTVVVAPSQSDEEGFAERRRAT